MKQTSLAEAVATSDVLGAPALVVARWRFLTT